MKLLACAFTAAALMAAALAPSLASAQAYPTRPIRLIVPTAAGGGYDFVGRLVADKLATELGQALVVENRLGSGTVVGTQVASVAPPDGYTLVMGGLANMALNAALYEKLPYSPSDFVPIGMIGTFSYTLVARKDLPQSTLREVIAYARANPGKLNMATGGNGSGQHLAAALFRNLANVDIPFIPYKGAQPVYTDLLGGRIDLFFDNTATVKPFVDSDRAKALVISSRARDPQLDKVPTGAESGLPGLVLESWIGLFAPAKTPRPVIEQLRAALAKVNQNPDVLKRLEASGTRPFTLPAAELERFVKDEVDKWPRLLRQAGIKPE